MAVEDTVRAPVDLAMDDLPHPGSGREWWYFHAHLTADDGRELSAFAAFFRFAALDGSDIAHSHSLTWAVVDVRGRRYHGASVLDSGCVTLLRERLAHDRALDPKVREALAWSVRDDRPPLPDRRIRGPVEVRSDRLDLRYGESGTVRKTGDGRYRVTVRGEADQPSLDLSVGAVKPPVWHGVDGHVASGAMTYYSVTRCDVRGVLGIGGERLGVATGSGWYDHEFGGDPVRPADGFGDPESSWVWAAVQLDNGWDLSFAVVHEVDVHSGVATQTDRPALATSPGGERIQLADFALHTELECTSDTTFNSYPRRLRFIAAALDVDLVLESAVAGQELRTILAGFGFWEGRVAVRGTMRGRTVSGVGFVEALPAQRITNLGTLLNRVSERTRRHVDRWYPARLTPAAIADFIGPGGHRYLTGLDPRALLVGLVQPIRHLLAAGGKHWRPFALVAALNLAGGGIGSPGGLMAAVELVHTASLIVDDVEDCAPVRRGVPAAHLRFGVPAAINAANAAYFVFDRAIAAMDLDDRRRAALYRSFCGLMRAAHVGQAADIGGHAAAMDRATATGDGRAALDGVLAVHRLKTAAPIRAIADVVAVLADLRPAAHTALADYLETVGLAYQVIDDVIDLRGRVVPDGTVLRPSAKALAEDLRNGKASFPVAMAVGLLPAAEMRTLWGLVRNGPREPAEIGDCIALLERSGAVDRCVAHARRLVGRAWDRLEPHFPPSVSAIMLRALGAFAVYRFENPPDPVFGDPPDGPARPGSGARAEPGQAGAEAGLERRGNG